ncbi:FAD-binding protein [Nonomuraea phyllanthi]|uniref:FAD-dependent oxidoreductase n=1 Tax=Nonomuraea phyllanthi TaxID=2219224 RepID=UPI001293F602|nr:FAD-dependent monooxygenase [Nonomuraea phyllanthi]QFY12126.1 FAD-binding protein [Nonomuraea phyllanthi]
MTVMDTPVLIVGGSLVGLSTALFLTHQGVRCTVVERQPHRSVQFRFGGIHARTMELYRSVGIEDDIRAAGTDNEQSGGVARVRNLADPEPQWMTLPWDGDAPLLSPTSFCMCPQDRLEPVLARHARRRGAEICFDTELRSFLQDDEGVTAVLVDRADGTERTIRTQYLVAADGVHGQIRTELGIDRHGLGVLEHWMSIIFRSDLASQLAGRDFRTVFLAEPNGSLVPRADGVWQLAVTYRPADGQRAQDFAVGHFTEQRCLELIRTATGRPDLEATIVDVMPWQAASYTAERFRHGRVFLVGDAAHVMPPTGAFGGNTGIHDAHNLAWKLAAVLSGAAGPELLDTYQAERKPVVERITTEALLRLGSWFRTDRPGMPSGTPVNEHTVMFGYQYRPGAGTFVDPRSRPAPVGTRAPHVPLDRDGKQVSTLDLLGSGFTLFAGPAGRPWCQAAHRVATAAGIRFDCHRLSEGDSECATAFGITPDGAVLIRPDGFIAWRSTSTPDDTEATLHEVLSRLLRRAPQGDFLTVGELPAICHERGHDQ